MAAALMGHAKTVAVLLTLGADEKMKLRGKTAYQMAAEKRHIDVCQTIKAVVKNRPRDAPFRPVTSSLVKTATGGL
jgi:hypothetical protein